MLRRAAVILVVAMLAAGCFGGGGKGGEGDADGSSTTSGTKGSNASGTSSAAGASVRFTWSPDYPRAGQEATFSGRVDGLGSRTVKSWAWDWGDDTSDGSGATAKHAFDEPGDWRVKLTVELSDERTLSQVRPVLVLGAGDAVPPGPTNGTVDAPPPAPPGEFDCPDGRVVEPHATFGTDDALPNLSWAVLKTGFRLAFLWTSEAQTTGSVRYTIGNGTPQTITESLATRQHLLVLDNLPEQRTVCFTVSMGGTTTALHAVHTANAMTMFEDGIPHGAYVVNTLTLVNEQGDLGEVQEAMDVYARMMWDATDGWVRAGATLVVANDLMHHNSGWVTCYIIVLGPPACHNVYDVLFTNDAAPQGAASTYRKGVRDRDAAIWMNQYHQAMPGPLSLDDAGAVLVHEMGHYLFDMDDLYGDNTVVTSECYDSRTGISIMAGSRAATEFDDPVTPCPNQPAGYTTSWELFQGEFPQVPDRPLGPVAGPEGTGDLYLMKLYRAA